MAAEDAAEAVEEPVVVDESQEEKETPETTEETDQPEESEESPELDKEIQSRDAQIKHWRDKAQKFEKEAKKNAPKVESKESEATETDDFRPRIEFLLTNRDLEEKEYSHISAVAMRDSGEITLESLQTAKETEKEYLSFLKEKADNKRKSPGSTSSGGVSQSGKSFTEIRDMSSEDHQKFDEKVMDEEGRGI